jgi:hypothetical protein
MCQNGDLGRSLGSGKCATFCNSDSMTTSFNTFRHLESAIIPSRQMSAVQRPETIRTCSIARGEPDRCYYQGAKAQNAR